LDTLERQAADYIYSQAQPAQWAVYLASAGRNDETIEFAKTAYARTPILDRPRLLDAWGIALSQSNKFRDAIPLFSQSIAIDPQYFPAYTNLMDAENAIGHEEIGFRVGQQMEQAAGGRPGRAKEAYYVNVDRLTWNLEAERAALVANRDAANDAFFDQATAVAELDALLHDPESVHLDLATATAKNRSPDSKALEHYAQGLVALDFDDLPGAENEMSKFHADLAGC